MRNRPRPATRNDESAIPSSRYARRACGASAGTTASAISSLSSGPRSGSSGTTAPSTRSEGAAPATSSKSAADRSTTCSSQCRKRAVCSSDAGARRTAFSSVTSASRSSGSFMERRRSSSRPREQRLVEEPREWRDLSKHAEQGRVERRAARCLGGQLAAREELSILQVLGGFVILRESERHALETLPFEPTQPPAESRRLDDGAQVRHVCGDVLANGVELRGLGRV